MTSPSLKHLDMIQASEYCYKHIPTKYQNASLAVEQQELLKDKFKVQLLMKKGVEVCPRCQTESYTQETQAVLQEYADTIEARTKLGLLAKCSVISDATIKMARFDNYEESGQEEKANKQKAMQLAELYKHGEVFNIWIQSPITGVGKSHLAMSILKSLNSYEASTLFLDLDQMMRLIKGSFNDKDSMYTEPYFVSLAIGVDYLVLDDLGAETGDVDTLKHASDYTSQILRAIMNGRQDKSTIITTNLSSTKLKSIYDPKVVSRLMTKMETIVFKQAKDKRFKKLDF